MRSLKMLCFAAALLLAIPTNGFAQMNSELPMLRIGVHSGVQTSLFRYNVFPFVGDYQETVEQSVVSGITLGLPINKSFRLQVDIGWWSQTWSSFHDGDPKIEIDRKTRSQLEFPILLHYRFKSIPVPFYIAAGPVVSLLTDSDKSYTVRYTGFTERDGWRTSSRDFEEETLHLAVVGEAGLEVPFTKEFSMQMAVRLTQPLGNAVDKSELSLRELSVWRVRLGFMMAL
jgi:Outer membrane protein beta-barrel domain